MADEQNGNLSTEYRKEKLRRRSRYLLVFLILAAAALFLTVLNINTGSTHIPTGRIVRILFTGEGDTAEYNVIWKLRLPRVLMAALLGGALSVSGFLLQTFFGNPIAGPYVLGISSGAKMTVALVMVFWLSRYSSVSSFMMVAAAFAGAMLSTGFILLISGKVRHIATLLVAGIMIGYICSAITDFVVTFAEDQDIVNLHGWSQGSFSGMEGSDLRIAALICGVTLAVVFFLSKPIAAYQQGEVYARSVGVNIPVFRAALILLSGVLSACVTAFAGPISFVGMAIPHVIRRSLGTARPIVATPAIFLGGAVFCMLCDLIARTAFSPLQLNISTVTSFFGAPIVIFMLLKGKR